MRLIRSKGVGVYFCSQNPDDVPDVILGQLGNRIQHALRAYTPRDQKAVRTAAETFVANPKLNVAKVISELAVGEALVSMLLDKGIPMPVERTFICPPRCRMGAITGDERAAVRNRSPVSGKYDAAINRDSAFAVSEITFSSMAMFAPGADGSLNILTGVDKAIGRITGPGTFESTTKSRITGGSGLYKDVTGRALSTSTTSVNLATGYTVADINVHGKICGIGQAGNN